MIPASIKQAYFDVPVDIKIFAKRAFLLIVSWVVLYNAILRPMRVPDKWLTDITAKATTGVANILYKTGFKCEATSKLQLEGSLRPGSDILYNNKPVLFIADGCNAFELYVLYLGFFLCLTTTMKRVLTFSLLGIIGIFILNVGRCFALAWSTLNYPSFVDFEHHYAFKLIVYGCVFWGWLTYAKKYNPRNHEAN